jgi:hypothetical protein
MIPDETLTRAVEQYSKALLNAPNADMRALWAWRAAIDRELSAAIMMLLAEAVAPLIPNAGAPPIVESRVM